MITVGVIPWAHVWPKARPLFYSKQVGENLDFASVHFYPKKGQVEKALAALAVYEVGKPLVVEEMFPLSCGIEELEGRISTWRGRLPRAGWSTSARKRPQFFVRSNWCDSSHPTNCHVQFG
jgi:hypothetical protein